jgi:nitrite reductase/ring-hydroxylating ferredoxin subunit
MLMDEMYDWHILPEKASIEICALAEQQLYALEIADKKICVTRVAGKWMGILNRCPHAGTPLSMGSCNKKGVIVCPTHHYKFHLHNGLSADGNHYKLPTFPLKIENGTVSLGVRKA